MLVENWLSLKRMRREAQQTIKQPISGLSKGSFGMMSWRWLGARRSEVEQATTTTFICKPRKGCGQTERWILRVRFERFMAKKWWNGPHATVKLRTLAWFKSQEQSSTGEWLWMGSDIIIHDVLKRNVIIVGRQLMGGGWRLVYLQTRDQRLKTGDRRRETGDRRPDTKSVSRKTQHQSQQRNRRDHGKE